MADNTEKYTEVPVSAEYAVQMRGITKIFGSFYALTDMLPYVITIIILILFVGRSAAPKASGIPYEKGARV